MRALVFAAGLGTRLKPFTLSHPKALAPVGGKPMLQRVIEKLIDAGVREIVVNVHHFHQQIIDFIAEHDNFGIDIHISDESALLLDTGGGLLAARQWLDRPDKQEILVHNADIFTDFPLQPMLQSHIDTGAMATLMTSRRDTSRYLLIDDNMLMRGWTNKSTGQVLPAGLDASTLDCYAFGGVHIVSPSIFPLLQQYAESPMFSIMPFYIQACQDHDIRAYEPQGAYNWIDIGKPESLEKANALF